MSTIAIKSNPKLWEEVKNKVIRGSKGGPPGKSSARKMQIAVAEYKAAKAHAPPQLILGLPDAFDVTGEYRYLLERHGLVASKISQSVVAKLHELN